jgi:hypothetical protein
MGVPVNLLIRISRRKLYEHEEKDSTLVIYFYDISSALVVYGMDV